MVIPFLLAGQGKSFRVEYPTKRKRREAPDVANNWDSTVSTMGNGANLEKPVNGG